MAEDDALFQKGMPIRRAVLGPQYCGIPAGLDAFRPAHEVLVAEGALPKPGSPAR